MVSKNKILAISLMVAIPLLIVTWQMFRPQYGVNGGQYMSWWDWQNYAGAACHEETQTYPYDCKTIVIDYKYSARDKAAQLTAHYESEGYHITSKFEDPATAQYDILNAIFMQK